MDYQPNTSLRLSLPDNQLNLQLVLEPSSSSPRGAAEPRIFSCNYCKRKFYSSQALGGHQNAHKLERNLAKKSRELSSVVRGHGQRLSSPMASAEQQGPAGGETSYGRREVNCVSMEHRTENVEEELSQLDLSLRL